MPPERRSAGGEHAETTPTERPAQAPRNRTRSRGDAVSDHLKPIVEALIFASPEPLTPKTLYKLLDGEPQEDVEAALAALRADYDRPGGLQLVEVAGGYQIVTRPELHEWVRRLFHERTTQKLSVQALETLAVIAYKQPITAPEIAEIRGVSTARRADHAARAPADQDRRPQAGRRPAVHVRDDARVPRPLRPERPRAICRRSRTWPTRSASSCRARWPSRRRRRRALPFEGSPEEVRTDASADERRGGRLRRRHRALSVRA